MPKLKTFSGQELVKIFSRFGFTMAAQKGSHIKLARMVNKERQILTIPNHPELGKGTIKAIFRQATRYISETELKQHFYTE